MTWSGDFLQDVLDKVAFCISDDDAMDAIACLCMKPGENGHIDVCGLNGHQFALVSFTHDDLAARLPAEGMLIQKKYLQDIKNGWARTKSNLILRISAFTCAAWTGPKLSACPARPTNIRTTTSLWASSRTKASTP